MGESDVDLYALDAAYKPFPTFQEWETRTSIASARWDRYVSSLETRAQGLSAEVLNKARNVAKRAAAIDTGAIEGLYEVDRGFTYTVALETAMWEAALAQKGEYVKSLFEAQLHAYDYVLDLATKAEPISEAAIRALHEQVCSAQSTYRVITAVGPQEQTLPKGQYKILPNHVHTRKGTDHSYAPVDVTPAEMARLTRELRGSEFLKAHPVVQAAYAHYGLVMIHPFADGNGRVARALASAFTYRSIRMPIVILSEHRDSYLSALENADLGEYQAFVDFMLARSLDTIELVNESLRSVSIKSAEESVAEIGSLYITRGGYTYEQIDKAAEGLMQRIHGAVTQEASKPKVVSSKVAVKTTSLRTNYYNFSLPPGYRAPMSAGFILHIVFSSSAPATAGVERSYYLLVPKDAGSGDDVQVVNALKRDEDAFVARVDELIPEMSGVILIRLNMFVERIVNEMFAELTDKARSVIAKRRVP